MNIKRKLSALAAVVLMACTSAASAAIVTVDAVQNSFGGGTPLDSLLHLDVSQTFSVTVDPSMIWNFYFGQPIADSNADGTGIGALFIATNPDGSTFATAIGTLIGQIGTGTSEAGNFFVVGTNFSGSANATGDLNLFYADTDSANNVGSVDANINAVPEPATLGLVGLGLVALARRRRT